MRDRRLLSLSVSSGGERTWAAQEQVPRIRRALLLYNTARYMVRFRRELIKALQGAGYEVTAVVPMADPACTTLREWGVHCENLPVAAQAINPAADVLLTVYLTRLFRRMRPDLVMSFTIKPVIFGSLAARLAGVPHIYSMITGLGYVFSGAGFRRALIRRVALFLYRLALKFNEKVFFQNKDDEALFLRERVVTTQQACRVYGSGIDLQEFTPSPDEASRKAFVLVARMIREKGVVDFVQAAKLLKKHSPDTEFWLVGEIDGNPSAIPRHQLERWESEGIIRYLGHVDDVRAIYAQAIAFVLPTYYREGIPRTILEAMSSGLPIITTDTPGCRETVVEGENGYLVSPRDPAMLADRMRRLLENRALAFRMGRQSRSLAQQFTVEKVTGTIMSAIAIARAV